MSALLVGPDGQSAGDLGYVPVKTLVGDFVEGGALSGPWFGLAFVLNLGSLGALAESAGFTATLVAAWGAGDANNPVAALLGLPGLGTGLRELGLQNVLRLTMKDIVLATIEQDAHLRALKLTFTDIGLSFLGIKLPRSGSTNIILFGDRVGANESALSWYAAYYAPQPKALRGA
jgi:hypothetical protein